MSSLSDHPAAAAIFAALENGTISLTEGENSETAASAWAARLAALATAGSSAFASPPGSLTCTGGAIGSGTYKGITVTGNCGFVPGAVITVNGNLVVDNGGALNDHAASTATVNVSGNVLVGKGAVLGLGTYNPAAPHNPASAETSSRTSR